MANHVNTYIRVITNDAGTQVMRELKKKLGRDPSGDYEKHLGYAFAEDIDDIYGRMIDLTSAKWAYVTEIDDDSIAIYSAWNYVERFCEHLASEIGAADPNVILYVNYEDEMPNFVGVSAFNKFGLDEIWELDHEQIDQYIRDNDSEIAAEYNEENCEYSNLGREYLSESMWDHISNWQHEAFKEIAGDDYLDKL